MAFVRGLVFLLLFGSALCFGVYALTGDLRYRRAGMVALKWTLAAAFLFFAVLIALRLVESS
ncbi:MAG: hypothetical protein ABI589_02100 [Burkholderiales bacterium]